MWHRVGLPLVDGIFYLQVGFFSFPDDFDTNPQIEQRLIMGRMVQIRMNNTLDLFPQ